MEDYDTPDDFEVEINTATSKRKVPGADKTKKPKKEVRRDRNVHK